MSFGKKTRKPARNFSEVYEAEVIDVASEDCGIMLYPSGTALDVAAQLAEQDHCRALLAANALRNTIPVYGGESGYQLCSPGCGAVQGYRRCLCGNGGKDCEEVVTVEEVLVGIIIGFVFCIAIIITLTIVVCCCETENNRLRRENRLLHRVLKDYQRLEQASLDAYAALERETQRQMGDRPF